MTLAAATYDIETWEADETIDLVYSPWRFKADVVSRLATAAKLYRQRYSA